MLNLASFLVNGKSYLEKCFIKSSQIFLLYPEKISFLYFNGWFAFTYLLLGVDSELCPCTFNRGYFFKDVAILDDILPKAFAQGGA